MRTKELCEEISSILAVFSEKITINSKNNILDDNIFSEYYFKDILNLIYDYNLINANDEKSNATAIDLKDDNLKIYFQVTSNKSKKKIDDTIKKLKLEGEFKLYFLFLCSDASTLKRHTYDLEKQNFDPQTNILDFSKLMGKIMGCDVNKVLKIYTICKRELGLRTNADESNSNLSKLIVSLSKINKMKNRDKKISFDIEKKIDFNNLVYYKEIIKKNAYTTILVDQIYNCFDEEAKNISFCVLSNVFESYNKSIKKYNELNISKESTDFTKEDLFFEFTIDDLIRYLSAAGECESIPRDELEHCIKIIVINTFLRCEIFKSPEEYNYDTTK